MTHPFRVFVSYSHDDYDLARKAVAILRGELGLLPLWDEDIQAGRAFSEVIKGMIAYAHVFLPLITSNSRDRPWVHQETGYAMALNIPVLPVAVGNVPGELIAHLQAIKVQNDLSDLAARLREARLDQLVLPPPLRPHNLVEVADWPETRCEMLVQAANRILDFGAAGPVLQRGVLTTFSIPTHEIGDPIWKERDAANPRSDYHHHLQREERLALERHARKAGCWLIVELQRDPLARGSCARRTRLSILRDFLASMPDDLVHVAGSPTTPEGNVTIVGDWFVAESLAHRLGGYRQTVFHWHAPTVLRRVRQFEQEFASLAEQKYGGLDGSRETAIRRIDELLAELR